jgi:hypothetical protein
MRCDNERSDQALVARGRWFGRRGCGATPQRKPLVASSMPVAFQRSAMRAAIALHCDRRGAPFVRASDRLNLSGRPRAVDCRHVVRRRDCETAARLCQHRRVLKLVEANSSLKHLIARDHCKTEVRTSPISTRRMSRRPRADFRRAKKRVHRARARHVWDCG